MPITSNTIHNNRGRSGNLNTTSSRRTYRAAGSNITVREGETLRGVVSDIHGNEITISLEDGPSFTGKHPEASRYSIGQKAAFLISGLENGTIYMKSISQAYLLGMEDAIEQALEEAGLPKSPRNLDIVRSLLKNQQSISKESINASLHLCARYPEADVDSVITMKRLGFPMTEATVKQFDQYQNQTHSLLQRMNQLTDSMGDLLTGLSKESPAIARYAANEVLNTALASQPSPEEQQLADLLADKNATQTPATTESENAEPTSSAAPTDAADDSLSGMIPNADETPAIHSTFAKMKQIIAGITEHSPFLSSTEEAMETSFITEQTGHLLSEYERTELTGLATTFLHEETDLTSLQDGTMTARKFLNLLKEHLPQLRDSDVADLLSSSGFRKLLKGQFLSSWCLSPETLKKEGSLNQLYQTMEKQVSELTQLSRMFGTRPAGAAMVNTANDLQQNLDFIKLINEQFTYMQLPLKLSQQNAHGDLYVMTKKNTLKQSKDRLKALLHLELDSLGSLDIHITKEYTNLSIRFYIAKESSRKLLEKNANLLQDSLNEKGFHLSSEFLTKEENHNLVQTFTEQEAAAPIGNITRYNFDLRA